MHKKIYEVMELVDEFALKTDAYNNGEASQDELFAARRAVKAKLRELLQPTGSEISGHPSCGVKAVRWEPVGAETEVDIEAGSQTSSHSLLGKLISWIKRSQNDLSA